MVLKGLLDEQHDERHAGQLGEVGRAPQLGVVLDHRPARCPAQLWLLRHMQPRCPPVGSGPLLLQGGVLFPPRLGWGQARELDSL